MERTWEPGLTFSMTPFFYFLQTCLAQPLHEILVSTHTGKDYNRGISNFEKLIKSYICRHFRFFSNFGVSANTRSRRVIVVSARSLFIFYKNLKNKILYFVASNFLRLLVLLDCKYDH